MPTLRKERIHLYAARPGDDALHRVGAPLRTEDAARWAVERLGTVGGYVAVAALTADSHRVVAEWPAKPACGCGCRA